MATLKIIGFSGEIPKLLPRLLPDMSAQKAFNTRLDDGGLTPVRVPRLVPGANLVSDTKTIYLHGEDWLSWDSVVNAAPGPVAQDRLYYTGDGKPKMRVGEDVYDLAVPFPTAALAATVSGSPTSDLGFTRVYVYTFVTSFGEESEPCPLSNEVYWEPGQTVTLSGFEAAPSGRAITHQRIYRGQTTASGSTELFFIAERAASNTNYTDDVPLSQIQGTLPSARWNPPPDELKGLIALPNGMMAGFVGKDLYFCEPFRPHAWPEDYVLTTDFDIVGLGAFGTSMAVLTTGNPYIVNGTHPATMIMEKLELNLPCINPRSIQDMGYAVAYATHDGLVMVSPGGARIATEQLMSRDDWMQLNPNVISSGQYQGRYFASYEFVNARGERNTGTIIIDLSGQQPFVIRSRIRAEAFYYDVKGSSLFFVSENKVFQWDATGEVKSVQTWRSKQFVLPRPTNFGAVMVEADDFLTDEEIAAIEALAEEIRQENAAIVASGQLDGSINSTPLNTFAINGDAAKPVPTISQFAAIAVYADRRLVATVSRVNEMARLPSGTLARMWEIEVGSDMQISQITLATTGAELAQV